MSSTKLFSKSINTKAGKFNTGIKCVFDNVSVQGLPTVAFEALPTLGFFLAHMKVGRKEPVAQTFVKVGKSVAYLISESGNYMDKIDFKKDRQVFPLDSTINVTNSVFVSAATLAQIAKQKKEAAKAAKAAKKAAKVKPAKAEKQVAAKSATAPVQLKKLPRIDRMKDAALLDLYTAFSVAGLKEHKEFAKMQKQIDKRKLKVPVMFDEAKIAELAASVKALGITAPVTAAPVIKQQITPVTSDQQTAPATANQQPAA